MRQQLLALTACLAVAAPVRLNAQAPPAAPAPPPVAGSQPAGADSILLPNGWRLTPAGKQIEVTDLPLNVLALPDSKTAVIATSGYNAHELSLVDLESGRKTAVAAVPQSWFGLAADSKSQRLWWSGGGGGVVLPFAVGRDSFTPSAPVRVIPEGALPAEVDTTTQRGLPGFCTGLLFDEARSRLFALCILSKGENKSFAWGDAKTDNNAGGVIAVLDPAKPEQPAVIVPCGKRPYDIALGKNGLLYVSDWADRKVLAVDPETLRTVARIPVGDHPNQIVVHPEDGRLFVACASSNGVWVIDPTAGVVQETIFTALFPQSPEGSTPDALCLSADGETLFVANADNNCVAVIDVESPRRSAVQGYIPTGWYPTSLATTPDGKTLLVGIGKGIRTEEKKSNKPEAEKIAAARAGAPGEGGYYRIPFPHIGTTLSGALSIIDLPGEEQLEKYTDQVYRNCPYADEKVRTAKYERPTAIPTQVGAPSPIKHVIYIIKENRTYDQVFSDIPRGNRDPSLLMFGEDVTPNHHKLANEFVLLDNLYCNGHVSADGHPWSTAAYNTDYIARNWALTYSRREGIDDDDEGDLSTAPSGYIWDACKRNGLTYRSYGEYGGRVSEPDGTLRIEGRVPGLVGHMSPKYGIPKVAGQPARDTDRVETFLEEFAEYEKNGDLPRFVVMSLGEDHTQGTRPGAPTPQACVASNDLALGRLVEAISKSRYWKETAIFVIEDDAQNGPDHVDAHRTIGLVISPYVRRGHLDSTQYQTVSMLRTMELILGLPPLSQFDAAATPMFESFTDKPDLRPYEHVDARIDLDAKNGRLAYGADRSEKMDFSEYDRIDDFELNEILWRAIHGKDAPLPPAVRRAIAYRGLELPAERD
ncbi:alkaline phosphatase family protein [Planctomyces sp. SH-PL14]|uniref:alkaline phosphatase family protein n=1 Tax=Planctomyces sp. SH-PL14 TaxID=1632864 RepID=UPI00078C5EF3|nr:alkaline phosphatase family protein [Planctomyces sp. SH-PL14]AMV16285.1 Phosphoesterase family protein [Planctomyces sp. SH-PL14]